MAVVLCVSQRTCAVILGDALHGVPDLVWRCHVPSIILYHMLHGLLAWMCYAGVSDGSVCVYVCARAAAVSRVNAGLTHAVFSDIGNILTGHSSR